MRKIIIAFLFIVYTSGFAQAQSLNDYKYALVPSKFSFQDKKDEYKLNTYTKMFLEKYGFTAYLDNEVFPEDFANLNCNKVFIDLEESSSMFATTIRVIFKDCRNKVIYRSEEGISRDKNIEKAYQQALREAFNTFSKTNYAYNGKGAEQVTGKQEIVLQEPFEKGASADVKQDAGWFSAQPIENGFQIIDTTPKVVLRIFKISRPDLFIAETESAKGILRKSADSWIFEYYENNKLISKAMNIRF
ncbi:MAG TPA: hypothetical protein VGB50_09695 [Flavobacterium sp.]|jgi:hypothetical protein